MLDRRKVRPLIAAVTVSLVPLVGIVDAPGRGACAPETTTASSRARPASLRSAFASLDGCPVETGWAAGGIAPGLFGS